ncbi:hypothetical protein D9M68_692850 [compost metagenome]
MLPQAWVRLYAERVGAHQLELVQQAEHAALSLLQLLLHLLLLCVLGHLGQIEIALQRVHQQLAAPLVLDFGREILRHILLGTPQCLGFDKPTQAFKRRRVPLHAGLDGALILPTELIQPPQEARLDKVEKTPQIDQRVLNRRPRAGDTESRGDCFRRLRDQRRRVLDLLRLVADHDGPLLPCQGEFLITQGFIGGQHDTSIAHPTRPQKIFYPLGLQIPGNLVLLELHSAERAAIKLQYRQCIRIEESLQLTLPVIQQGNGGNNQDRFTLRILLQIPNNEGQQLDGLTQAHVIGKQATRDMIR